MRKELLILHCRTGGGHTAAAEALAERARARGVPARTLDALSYAPSWFGRAYVDAHLGFSAYLPEVYGTAYFASNHRSAVDGEMRRHFDHWISKTLLQQVVESDPLAVITTHFFPMGILAAARREGRLLAPLVEVVTDYAAHAVWAEPGADAYCAPRQACEDLVRHGISASLIADTGIPIRFAFAQARAVAALPPDAPLRILVTSGGFGVGPVTRVLRSLAKVPRILLDIVCGNNPPLVARARRLCERLGIEADVVGFESNMAARVARADIVVTKPGGLTMSECLAAGRPLVLVGAVRGQETLNQAWAVEEGAAVACDPQLVGRVVAELRNGRLAQMAERARALAIPYAADRVLDLALALSVGRTHGSDLSTLSPGAPPSGQTYKEAQA